jgi:cytochrome P450
MSSTAQDLAITSLAEATLFSHPDDTSYVDGLDDPVRTVAELQKLGPIIRGESLQTGYMMRFGDVILPNILTSPQRLENGVFAALTWEAGRAVYMDPARFSSSALSDISGKNWGHNLSEMDPPIHTKFRMIVQKGFMPKMVASWDADIIRPILKQSFDAIKPKGHADLVRELTAFFPYKIVGAVVGFDPEDIVFVGRAFHNLYQGRLNPETAQQASIDLKSYSKKLIDARRRSPTSDLVSVMTLSEIDDEPIPDETFIGMVIHLMAGGIDTVYRISSNIVHLLLNHPEQFERLKADRTLISSTIEETLRYQGVASMLPRMVMEDTDLLGVHMPKGSIVYVINAAVNRDPARWSDPHTFDISRAPLPHMAFGNGAHSCIGVHLARFELKQYLEHVLDDLPNLRWDPSVKDIPRITGWTIRGTNSLPVVWGA